MAKTRTYQHFCPVARSLEVIGEKWSLLIVRDLLAGPQRFSDLLRYLGGITPKWLTLRLRDLEEAGIVEVDRQAGRREVWYRLTPKGRDLAPVVESLAVWGIGHARRPPLPGEPIHPAQITYGATVYLNEKGIKLDHPVTWVVRFASDRAYTIGFDGESWSIQRGEAPADLVIEATAEAWVHYLMTPPGERPPGQPGLQFHGSAESIAEFAATFAY